MSVTVDCETTAHVAKIMFSNPPNNHVNTELLSDIAGALEAQDADLNIRAIVLTGTGRHFCAGADLVARGEAGVGEGSSLTAFYDQALRLFATQKPIIAAIQGAAVGAGLGLALAADARIASPRARFAANFTKLGFHPGFGLSETLPALIGIQRANLMFLTARRYKPDAMLEWGLIDAIEAEEDLLDAARALAAEIAENAPLALVSTRQTLREGMVERVRAALQHEYKEQSVLRGTEDYKEGVSAVNTRRPAQFRGR